MPATFNYNRDKDPSVNVTPIDVSLLAAEKPTAPAAVAAGTTGQLDLRIQGDADPGAGTTLVELFKVEVVPTFDSAGNVRLNVTVTPKLGDGSDGTAQALNLTHPQTLDAWQTAAGFPRQP